MKTTKHFLALLLCVLLCVPATLAQSKQNTISQDVTIIIQQEQVRFAAQRIVEQLHLQVTDQAGEVVFDSGAAGVQEINWPLQYASGAALKSGLYAYTLTVKEAGANEARARRGHFIVDRAQDRDGADKLWVTSQKDSSVGTELTVARDENTTIAGVTAPHREEGKERGEAKRDGESESKKDKKTAKAEMAVAGFGEPGQIAKFDLDGGIEGSAITEVEGNVGIGTGEERPVSKLDVRGWLTLDPGVGVPNAIFTAAYGGEQNRYLGLFNSPSYPSASGLKAGGVLVADDYNFAYPGKNNLVVKGAVGVGTASPFGELHIAGYGPVITLESRQNGNRLAHIQNADGNLVFKPAGFGSCCAAMVIQPNTGNIGIGTSSPERKLHVVGSGVTETRITSSNSRAALGLSSTINGQNSLWSLESGLANNPGWFGVYDVTQNRLRLWIESNGMVNVNALRITGGADFAENFDVNEAPESSAATATKVEAGMVVSIDPTNPGKLQLSAQAYDRRVVGIISGAGGVQPGMMMSQEGTLADGKQPVALSGRVYAWVDATRGAVKPGDLLTTSATPGHAMKAANPSKAQGAIIGKAMTGLKEGKGLVLVLVTLQ